ncbi:MAG: nicotinate (nicotinamide) nucleotide adenylyltransferase [Hydrogenothermaceae bacterium]|nr:nicotinate (nicotinamide) nucleotide adenylyltransferase [Hydrogenothermaceae bacterium]
MAVALFGGSFDPVHLGHLRIAEDIREYFNLERIIFVPAYLSPLKFSHSASAVDRLNMLTLAISDNPNFEISTYEIEKIGKSYSIDTVNFFKERLGYNPAFIVGTDAFLTLERWKEPKKLLNTANFIVVSRDKVNIKQVKEVVNKIDSNVKTYNNNVIDFSKTGVYLYFQRRIDISSTEIRDRIKKGLSIRYLVTREVADYIYKNNLYR